MAEVHIFGHIESATGFPDPACFCKFAIHTGSGWKLLSGIREGQTQVDTPAMGETANFCHPIDVHYSTRGLQGWPKIHVQVWHHDAYGRDDLYGYGFSHIPTSPGSHEVDILTWRPVGTFFEQVAHAFVGGGPQLTSPDLVYTGAERQNLRTVAMGSVHLRLHVLLRNFDRFGIEC